MTTKNKPVLLLRIKPSCELGTPLPPNNEDRPTLHICLGMEGPRDSHSEQNRFFIICCKYDIQNYSSSNFTKKKRLLTLTLGNIQTKTHSALVKGSGLIDSLIMISIITKNDVKKD